MGPTDFQHCGETIQQSQKCQNPIPFCYSNVDVNKILWYHWIDSLMIKYTLKPTKKETEILPWVSNDNAELSIQLNTLSIARQSQQPKTSEILQSEQSDPSGG